MEDAYGWPPGYTGHHQLAERDAIFMAATYHMRGRFGNAKPAAPAGDGVFRPAGLLSARLISPAGTGI
jgi:hypothetical protein